MLSPFQLDLHVHLLQHHVHNGLHVLNVYHVLHVLNVHVHQHVLHPQNSVQGSAFRYIYEYETIRQQN